MPISNIVDKRTNKYDVEIDVVFEPSYKDNSVKGASQFSKPKNKFTIESICKTTIEDAIEYITRKHKNCQVTMFLYDSGSGPIGKEEYFLMN